MTRLLRFLFKSYFREKVFPGWKREVWHITLTTFCFASVATSTMILQIVVARNPTWQGIFLLTGLAFTLSTMSYILGKQTYELLQSFFKGHLSDGIKLFVGYCINKRVREAYGTYMSEMETWMVDDEITLYPATVRYHRMKNAKRLVVTLLVTFIDNESAITDEAIFVAYSNMRNKDKMVIEKVFLGCDIEDLKHHNIDSLIALSRNPAKLRRT